MLQYKSNEKTREKMKLLLKARNQEGQLGEPTKLIMRTKRKLLVYRRDGKFYIDHSAAYALGLTNVRSIMTEKAHLIEIGIETLHRFQSNKDIEIIYQELDKEQKSKTKQSNLEDTLGKLEQGEYGIGIHGIDKGNREEKQSIAESINSQGLDLNNNSKTILSTAISLGVNEDSEKIRQEIVGYKFGEGTKANVIVAVPSYVQNEEEEKIFLGFPEKNRRTAGQQYEEHCIFDRICSKLRKIPPQFILGYYCEEQDGSQSFIKNEQHYSDLPPKEKEKLFKELSANMDDISKNFNELISSRNMEQLHRMKEQMEQEGWKSYMVDNAITLAKSYKEQPIRRENTTTRKILENIDDSVTPNEKIELTSRPKIRIPKTKEFAEPTIKSSRRIRTNTNEPSHNVNEEEKSRKSQRRILTNIPNNPIKSELPKSKRRLLSSLCKEIKSSDLHDARRTLEEGRLEEQNKNENEKGNEI